MVRVEGDQNALKQKDFGHNAKLIGPSWPEIVARWDAARRGRYEMHLTRLVGLGWAPDSARFLAYERVVTEDLGHAR